MAMTIDSNANTFQEYMTIVDSNINDELTQSAMNSLHSNERLIEETITSAEIPLEEEEVICEIESETDNVISQIEGVILKVSDEFVSIKLKEITVDFPKILFQSKDFVEYGQEVIYQIKLSNDGFRYQDFIKKPKSGTISSQKAAVIALLDSL